MPIKAEDWNVTIVGFWNRAIYTPAGISRHLFGLANTTPVEVLIPIDLPAPYQIKYEGLTITVGADRLVVHPSQCNFSRLAAAMQIGIKALDHLPRTPLIAAGINVRYKSDGPLRGFDEIVANALDERLSDQGLEIGERTFTREIRRKNGRINVAISQKSDGTFLLGLNFDIQSDDVQQLRDWVSISESDLRIEVERIMIHSLQIPQEEVIYG